MLQFIVSIFALKKVTFQVNIYPNLSSSGTNLILWVASTVYDPV